MGMFDTVYVHESAGLDLSCKVCGKTHFDFQSKDFDCNMGHVLITRTDDGVKAFRLEDPDKNQWWVEYTPEEYAKRIAEAKKRAARLKRKDGDNLATNLVVWWAENETGYWKDDAWKLESRRPVPFEAGLPHQHVFIYDGCSTCKRHAWNEWRLKFTDGVVVECVRVPEGEES